MDIFTRGARFTLFLTVLAVTAPMNAAAFVNSLSGGRSKDAPPSGEQIQSSNPAASATVKKQHATKSAECGKNVSRDQLSRMAEKMKKFQNR